MATTRAERKRPSSLMNRRDFIACSSTAVLAIGVLRSSLFAATAAGRAPRILLRSSWQSVNIGDIGHTPGALSLQMCPPINSTRLLVTASPTPAP